jgi:hypothetical protein
MGRPPLSTNEPSLSVSVKLLQSDYDRACRLAQHHHSSVADIIRRAFAVATRRRDTIADPDQ